MFWLTWLPLAAGTYSALVDQIEDDFDASEERASPGLGSDRSRGVGAVAQKKYGPPQNSCAWVKKGTQRLKNLRLVLLLFFLEPH